MPHPNLPRPAPFGRPPTERWPAWVGVLFVLGSAAALWAALWLLFLQIMTTAQRGDLRPTYAERHIHNVYPNS